MSIPLARTSWAPRSARVASVIMAVSPRAVHRIVRPTAVAGMRGSPHLRHEPVREPFFGQEALLHGEQPGGGPAGGAELRIDVLDVVADGLGSDHEASGDLLVRQPDGQELEDLDLT